MQVSWRSEQTRSTSSQPRLPVLTTHTVLPGPVNVWSLFPRTYFFLPGAFFRKTFFRRNQVAPLIRWVPEEPGSSLHGHSARGQSVRVTGPAVGRKNPPCTGFGAKFDRRKYPHRGAERKVRLSHCEIFLVQFAPRWHFTFSTSPARSTRRGGGARNSARSQRRARQRPALQTY